MNIALGPEISHCRERVWETVTDREHTVARVYALDDSCSDLMINGVAKTTFAAGTLDVTPFVARLLLTGYGEELRIKHMQVFIVRTTMPILVSLEAFLVLTIEQTTASDEKDLKAGG